MLWEHEPQVSVSTAFSSSPKLSRVESVNKVLYCIIIIIIIIIIICIGYFMEFIQINEVVMVFINKISR